jgi:ABC-type Mn2+/Zn2+ transport system ATPase subunit
VLGANGSGKTSLLRAILGLVGQGVDGHRRGIGRRSAARRLRIDAVLDAVGAGQFADMPIGLLSGGEKQRGRIAQALVADPRILLCDEPLLSLAEIANGRGAVLGSPGFPSGTRWKNSRGPTPEGSTHANAEP